MTTPQCFAITTGSYGPPTQNPKFRLPVTQVKCSRQGAATATSDGVGSYVRCRCRSSPLYKPGASSWVLTPTGRQLGELMLALLPQFLSVSFQLDVKRSEFTPRVRMSVFHAISDI